MPNFVVVIQLLFTAFPDGFFFFSLLRRNRQLVPPKVLLYFHSFQRRTWYLQYYTYTGTRMINNLWCSHQMFSHTLFMLDGSGTRKLTIIYPSKKKKLNIYIIYCFNYNLNKYRLIICTMYCDIGNNMSLSSSHKAISQYNNCIELFWKRVVEINFKFFLFNINTILLF